MVYHIIQPSLLLFPLLTFLPLFFFYPLYPKANPLFFIFLLFFIIRLFRHFFHMKLLGKFAAFVLLYGGFYRFITGQPPVLSIDVKIHFTGGVISYGVL